MVIAKEDRAQCLSVSPGAPRRGMVFDLFFSLHCRTAAARILYATYR